MEKIETPVNRLRRIFNESGTISDLDWQEAIEAEQIEMMTAVDLFVYHKKFTEDAFKTWYAENYQENPSTECIYKNIQSKENYDKLLSSGMFWEFHPELTGNWYLDEPVINGR